MHGSKMLHRHENCPSLFRRLPLLCGLGLPLVCLIGGMGCESVNDSGPTTRPGDAVLKDPMNYKIGEFPSISGDSISDHKGLKRDVDVFFNP